MSGGVRAGLDAACRRGAAALGDAAPRSANLLKTWATADGGWRGRSGTRGDLYYTSFALGAARALGAALPERLPAFISGLGDGAGLDLLHLACLVSLRAQSGLLTGHEDGLARRILALRADNGGFSERPGVAPSAYGAFLAVGALDELGRPLGDPARLLAALDALRTRDGGWANEAGRPVGLTAHTAGVLVLRQRFGAADDEAGIRFLRASRSPLGGFTASPQIPVPDLLSTATALHALGACGGVPTDLADPCRRFLDAVWIEEKAGFCAHALDRSLDAEYLWYGLLALGHLG